jgi:conjugative transposon TraK protein
MNLFKSKKKEAVQVPQSNLEDKIAFSFASDIDKQFKATRYTMHVVMVFCMIVAGFAIYKSFSFASNIEEESKRIIYTLDNGDEKSYIGLKAINKTVNRRLEAKYHMKNFHKIFYTLYPNLNQIKKNIIEAGNYGDKSILRLYQDYLEKQYYPQIVQGNVHQLIDIDSVDISINKPYKVKTYATLTLVRESIIETHSLITENFLTESYRTEENPAGFQIERFREVYRQKTGETTRE